MKIKEIEQYKQVSLRPYMENSETQIIDFVHNELKKANLTTTPDLERIEGLDYLITAPTGVVSSLQVRAIHVEEQRAIKILKFEFGEVSAQRFIGLVSIISGTPRALYLIPSEILNTPDNFIFFDNEVAMMPHLSNWEINVFTAAIPELAKYEISNFYM